MTATRMPWRRGDRSALSRPTAQAVVGHMAGTLQGLSLMEDVWLVDPDLLDGGVVEVLLEGAVAGDDGEDRVHRLAVVAQRRQTAVERALVVVLDGVLHETAYGLGVARGVEPRPSDQLTDL